MPSIGLPELVLVFVIALLVVGPKRLPDLGRQVGRAMREFRAATSGIRSELGVDDIVNDVNDIKSTLSFDDVRSDVEEIRSSLTIDPDTVAPPAPVVADAAAADSPPADAD